MYEVCESVSNSIEPLGLNLICWGRDGEGALRALVRLSSWEGGNIVQFSEREQHLVGHVTTEVFFQSSLTMAPLTEEEEEGRQEGEGTSETFSFLSCVLSGLGKVWLNGEDFPDIRNHV